MSKQMLQNMLDNKTIFHTQKDYCEATNSRDSHEAFETILGHIATNECALTQAPVMPRVCC